MKSKAKERSWKKLKKAGRNVWLSWFFWSASAKLILWYFRIPRLRFGLVYLGVRHQADALLFLFLSFGFEADKVHRSITYSRHLFRQRFSSQ